MFGLLVETKDGEGLKRLFQVNMDTVVDTGNPGSLLSPSSSSHEFLIVQGIHDIICFGIQNK